MRRGNLQLWSVRDVRSGDVPASAQPALSTIVDWSAEYLIPEHPDLGRDGPVCPFTKTSMEQGLFLLGHLRANAAKHDITQTIVAFREWYLQMATTINDRLRKFLTFVLVMQDVDPADATEIDDLHRSLKDSFVEQGLMLGEFHPANAKPGLWNEEFRPLRSPIPLLVIRVMVQNDLPFLVESEKHLDAYLSNFAPELPVNLRSRLIAAMRRNAIASAEKTIGSNAAGM
jgi:hypothetical protein